MELSKRLHMVASMVEKGSIPADVGCDHGYVAIYLIQNGISPHVFAMDVNEGPPWSGPESTWKNMGLPHT